MISKDKEYRFCVKGNTTLVAKFTDKRVKVGNKYKIKKHTYKVTSVKKRTVSFVKTTSKSKTIKIPSTVKINGKKYKVTTIATSALKGNKKVTKVIIGSNVTKIGKKAFYNCKRLKNITIKSKKLKSVGKYAFKGIAKYATIKCPGKKTKKYKEMIKKSKVGKNVIIK